MRRPKIQGSMLIRQMASAEELLHWINSYVIEDFDEVSHPAAKVIDVLRLTNFHKKEIEFFEKRLREFPLIDIKGLITCLVARGSYCKDKTVYLCMIFEETNGTSVFWNEFSLHGVILKNANAIVKPIDLTGFIDVLLSKKYVGNEGEFLKLRHILATERAKNVRRRVIILGESRKVFKGSVVNGLKEKFCRERFSALFCLHVMEPSKLELSRICRAQDVVVHLTCLDGRILLRDSGGRYYWIVEQIRSVKSNGSKSILMFAGDFSSTRKKKEGEGVSYLASDQIISRLETQEAYLATAFKNVISIGSEVDEEVSVVIKDLFDQSKDPHDVCAEDWSYLLGVEAQSIWDSCNIVRIALPAMAK